MIKGDKALELTRKELCDTTLSIQEGRRDVRTEQIEQLDNGVAWVLKVVFRATDEPYDSIAQEDCKVAEYRNYKLGDEEDYGNMYWRRTEFIDGEDGELSWFNACVRVGVGIRFGICVGVGIGVGLLVRTYQSTTQNFKRQLL
ncbi:hypothetical protein LINPERPRIM_LOCUS21749 [Linum perenne]